MANWWTRLPCRLRNDARLAKCDLAAGWVYCCHLTMEADQSFECGPDEKWLAAQCNATPKEYRKLKAQLVAVGLLTKDGRVLGYAEMQVKDPANSERQARYRERARGRVSGNAPHAVTSNVTSNGAREEKSIEEEEGDSSATVDDSTREGSSGAGQESPPDVAHAPPETRRDRLATKPQRAMAAEILAQHGLTVSAWLQAAGHDDLMHSHIDEIKAKYGGRQSEQERERAETQRRNEQLRALKRELRDGYAADPTRNWRQWIGEQPERLRFALGATLQEMDGSAQEGGYAAASHA